MGNIKLYQAFPVSPSYNSQSAIRVAISQLVVRGLKQDSVSLIVQYRLVTVSINTSFLSSDINIFFLMNITCNIIISKEKLLIWKI